MKNSNGQKPQWSVYTKFAKVKKDREREEKLVNPKNPISTWKPVAAAVKQFYLSVADKSAFEWELRMDVVGSVWSTVKDAREFHRKICFSVLFDDWI
jgi:hypothetical protein